MNGQLSSYRALDDASTTATSTPQKRLVETVLLARIEFLEAQLEKLQNNGQKSTDHKPFSIDEDDQVSGFPSFAAFFEFYQFLDPLLTNFISGESNQMLGSSIVLQSLLQ